MAKASTARPRRAMGSRPAGREEIRKAVVRSATRLFAERGPAAVSLRDVARNADVTLSQIHRHIGNKDSLLESVLAADLQAGSEPARADGFELADLLVALFQLQEPSVRTKLQARIVLDGYDLSALQKRYPGVERTIELLREHLPDDQARVRAAVLTTFFAGWQLLGPMYLRVTGAEDTTPEEFSRIVRPLLGAIATAPRAD